MLSIVSLRLDRHRGWAMMMAMMLVLLISIASTGLLSLLKQEKKRLDSIQITIAKEMIIDQMIYLFFTETNQISLLKTILTESNKMMNDKLTCSLTLPINQINYVIREKNAVRILKASVNSALTYTPKNRYKAWLTSKNTKTNTVCGQPDHFRVTQKRYKENDRCGLYSVMLCVSALESGKALSQIVNIEMVLP